MFRRVAGVALIVAANAILGAVASAEDARVARGRYLVTVISCGDCHTNGALAGEPDTEHPLGGSDIGFYIPNLGYFYGPNLTPDRETGLGGWNAEQIATAITTGVRPDGRVLAPVMPWHSFSHLTREDAMAIALYLKSLPAVKHKSPGPFGPSDKPSSPYMALTMPPS